jgi:DNA polymerase-1
VDLIHEVGTEGAGYGPLCVLTEEQLQEVVDAVLASGEFAFDVETRGNIHRHGDVMDLIDHEWYEKEATLKSMTPSVRHRSRKAIEDRWTKELALDPLRNEVFWIGISVAGRSWAIPMGHPHGEVVVPAIIGDGTTVPPHGYREILSSGKESKAKAKFMVPAVYSPPPKQLSCETVFSALEPLFMDENIVKIGHNIKFDARSVAKYIGGLPNGRYVDTMVLQHYLDENIPNFSLQSLIARNFNGLDPYARDGKVGKIISDVAFSVAHRYVHIDVRWTWLLYKTMWRKVQANKDWLDAVYTDLDLLYVIADMEQTGISVDKSAMVATGKELDQNLNYLLRDMADYAPPGFNPDSLEHKRQLLFGPKNKGGLGLSPVRQTGTGKSSVDDTTLQTLRSKHPVVQMMLDWAETKKLKSTYVDGMMPMLHSGRLHPSFHLHRTVTARISSSGPNLQNIPRDGRMRSVFVAGDKELLVVADYDQIELRVMAMFSQDRELIRIFTTNEDIHRGTAALILSRPPSEVSDEERTIYGKVPNFLMGYGGGPKRLIEATNGVINLSEAKRIIDAYHDAYAGLTKWKREVIQRAYHIGYVETLGRRRRRLTDIKSDDFALRSRAERQAINFIVQGTAAEICKKAMVRVHRALPHDTCRLLVQVHDELMISVPEKEADHYAVVLQDCMGDGTVINGVPLRVTAHSGKSWYEAKG